MSQCLSWARKNKKIIVGLVLFLAIIFFILPKLTLAEFGLEYATVSGLGTTALKPLIFRVINIILGFLGIVAVIIVLYGGFVWMTAGGNRTQLEKAKKVLINGAIGLGIIIASWSIAHFLLLWLTGQGLIGGGGGPGSPGGPGGGQGAFGSGIIESHYPGRNATEIPRNTKIIITFKEDMDGSTLIAAGQINSANIKISTKAEATIGPYLNNVSAVTADNRTFVFAPNELLGSPSEDVWYRVQLTNDILKANGQVALPFGYSWDFEVSTFLDNTPPKIIKIKPVQNSTNARNTIIQINFSEAIDPISIANITITDGVSLIAGALIIANQYRTVEFTPDLQCGINACGSIIHCLPANSDIVLTIPAAAGANLPQADFPYNGIVDMASNSLDANGANCEGDNTVVGPPADNCAWQFKTNDAIDATPPKVLAVEPSFGMEGVKLNAPARILFDSPMRYGTLNSTNIILAGGVNYWISAEDKKYCLDVGSNGIRTCGQDSDCLLGVCSTEEITLATVNHDRFAVKTQYKIDLNQEIQDDKQNCLVPAESCACPPDYSCCNGICVDEPDCSNVIVTKTNVTDWVYNTASQSITKPTDLDVDLGSGDVYVVSWDQNVIYKCNSSLTGCSVFFGQLGAGASGYNDDNLLLNPIAIAVFKTIDALVVVDNAGSSRVMVIDKKTQKVIAKLHFAPASPEKITAIATDYNNKIFFVRNQGKVFRYSQNLAVKEKEKDLAVALQGAAVDKNNDIYLTAANHKIIKYDNNLAAELAVHNVSGAASEAQTNNPKGLDVDIDGNIYVVEGVGQRAFKFNNDLTVKEEVFGKYETAGSDSQHLNNSAKISLSQNVFYIADYGNNRVIKIIKKTTIASTGPAKCGNSACDSGECLSCPADCSAGQCCGDGLCQANAPLNETQTSCPADCTAPSLPSCGSGGCEPSKGETCANCPTDCGCGAGKLCCGSSCVSPACGVAKICNDNNNCTIDTCLKGDTCLAGCQFRSHPDDCTEFDGLDNDCDGQIDEHADVTDYLTNVDFEQGAVGAVPTDWSRATQKHSSVGISQTEKRSGSQSVLLHQDPNQAYPGICDQATCADIGVKCTWLAASNQCTFSGYDQCHVVDEDPANASVWAIYNQGQALCEENTHKVMWGKLVYNVAPLSWQAGKSYLLKFYYKNRTMTPIYIQLAYDLGWPDQCLPKAAPYLKADGSCLYGSDCSEQPGRCCLQAPVQTKCYTYLNFPAIIAGTYNDWTLYSTTLTYTQAMTDLKDKNGILRNEIGLSFGYNNTGPQGTDFYVDDFTISSCENVP